MKVLIFGLGLNEGGVGSAKFFVEKGMEVLVTDLKSADDLKSSLEALKNYPNIKYTLGEHKFEDFDWADLIIKNPAVKPGNKFLEYANGKGKKVEMDMGIFLDHVRPNQIIGVTGTKGKSTTASLIYEILKDSRECIFAGNIGKSVLETIPLVKPNTLVVLELSSFQLAAFGEHKVSPKWAVITNIYPDHLNYYESMKEYVSAKRIIGKYQTKDDNLIIRKGDLVVDQPDFLTGLRGQVIRFSKEDLPPNLDPKLPGEHNLENMAAALAVGKIFKIDENKIIEAISSFKGIPFRQELIGEFNGVKVINDSAATGPDAGIAALKTFPQSIVICGGMNKNMPYSEYARILNQYAKKVFFLEGDATEEIKQQLSVINSHLRRRGESFSNELTYNNLEELIVDVKKIAKPGDIILFSPAATSFNLFQNEFDRGRKFNEAVQKIFR